MIINKNAYGAYTEEDLEKVKKNFPIGSKFLYHSKYGAKLTLTVSGHHTNSSSFLNRNYETEKHITEIDIIAEPYDHNYPIEYCIPLLREKKLKRILGK